MAQVRIVDVAREAGVSLGTVSNALNHPDRVRPETRRLIEEAIQRLGYVPNQSARLLAGGHNTIIGLVLPRLNHGASLQIANGAQAEAHKLGFNLLIADATDDPDQERRNVNFFQGTHVAGIMVQPVDPEHPLPATPATTNLIHLDVDREGPGCYVSADCVAQGRLIAEHLVKQGATRVAVIGHVSSPQMRQRLEGIHKVLVERPDLAFEALDAGEWNVSGDGYTLGQQLAQRATTERPDAIIGLTDVLAAGALAGAMSTGLHVPDDLLVAGCDGNPLAWCGVVALTTCAPAGYEIGRRGVQIIAEHYELAKQAGASRRERSDVAGSDTAEERRHEIVRPFLLARASTGVLGLHGPLGISERTALVPELNLGAYL